MKKGAAWITLVVVLSVIGSVAATSPWDELRDSFNALTGRVTGVETTQEGLAKAQEETAEVVEELSGVVGSVRQDLESLTTRVAELEEPTPDPDPDPDPDPIPDDPLARPLITQKDIAYIGSYSVEGYNIPDTFRSSAHSDGGLAHRHVDGTLRFASTPHSGYIGVYEFELPEADPSLDSDTATWPVCRVVAAWPAIGNAIKAGNSNVWAGSCHWDAARGWYWIGARNTYNAVAPDPCSYIAFNPATGETFGPFLNNGMASPELGNGLTSIPQWFADRYLDGANLLVGNGWRVSGQGARWGTSIGVAKLDGETLTMQRLIERVPLNSTEQDGFEKRPPTYNYRPDTWLTTFPPEGEIGYATGGDQIRDSLVWVDLPDKHGIIALPDLGEIDIQYINGAINTTQQQTYWFVYDPAEIAESAEGTRNPRHVYAKSWWKFAEKGGFQTGSGKKPILGATLVGRRLYVLAKSGGHRPAGHTNTQHGLHVYEIRE